MLDAKDQDERLKKKLEARRKKKEAHLTKENEVKKDHMHERIHKALQDSEGYADKKKERSMREIEKMIKVMQMKMPPEEIPAAVERMIDDRHQGELEDMLLKLYEQKAIQLKEEILGMMEEKL